MHLRGWVLACVLAGLAVVPAARAAQTWTSSGPASGAFAETVAYSADGKTAFAGGVGVIYRSTDDGATWTAIALPPTLAGSLVLFVTPDPGNADIVVASTTDIGVGTAAVGDNVVTSSNAGTSWKLASGLPNQVSSGNTQFPYYLTWDPNTAKTVYAATAAGETGDVYRSTNGGVSWTLRYFASTTALPVPFGPILAVPTKPTSIYMAATDFNYSSDGDAYIAKSSNAATSFADVEPLNYVGYTGYGQVLTRFAYDPVSPGIAYAMVSGEQLNTFDTLAPYIDFLWTPNKGVNWVKRVSGIPANSLASTVAVDPASRAVLMPICCAMHHQLYHSTNEGAKWSALSIIPASSFALALKPGLTASQPATILTAGRGGVLGSADGGVTWADRTAGMEQPNFSDVVEDPATPATIYVGTKAGVLRSTDAGATLAPISAGLTDGNVVGLALDSKAATHILYAATLTGIYRCENPTAATPGWTEITPPGADGVSSAYALAVDGGTAGSLYVSNTRATPLANGNSTLREIWHTADSGTTWTTTGFNKATGNDYPEALIADPLVPGTIYAVAQDNSGVYKSTDSGKTFKEVLNGSNGTRLVFGQKDKLNARTLYLLSTDPNSGKPVILRTTNGGAAWDSNTTIPTGAIELLDIAADPASSKFYALVILEQTSPASYHLAVFESPNRGFTWTNVSGTLPSLLSIDISGTVATPPFFRTSGASLFVARPLQPTLSISPLD